VHARAVIDCRCCHGHEFSSLPCRTCLLPGAPDNKCSRVSGAARFSAFEQRRVSLCSALPCPAPRAPRRTKRASRFDFGSRSRCRGESSGICSTGRSAGGGCDAADLGGAADAAGVAIQWWVVLRVGRAACSMIQLIVSIPTTARALHVSNTLVEFDNYKLGSEASVEILAVRVN
jgi:hypothetical protein